MAFYLVERCSFGLGLEIGSRFRLNPYLKPLMGCEISSRSTMNAFGVLGWSKGLVCAFRSLENHSCYRSRLRGELWHELEILKKYGKYRPVSKELVGTSNDLIC